MPTQLQETHFIVLIRSRFDSQVIMPVALDPELVGSRSMA
jgi:hypothetical protein